MATDDDDAATLRERVRALEATVAQQQDTIQQLLPSRRAVLAGGAGLLGGAALTGQASAQSAAGQVGTSSEPVDVEAASVTADSVNTEEQSVGGQDAISYWPAVRIDSVTELSTTTPATSYSTLALSALPSDASVALLQIALKGDGSSSIMAMLCRESGTSRVDARVTGWAGHGAFTADHQPVPVPVNSSNEIDYEVDGSVADATIRSIGYF